ncbi:MAG: pyridoxamine 5'-phosphate oxidase family protein [Burkholderiaceae bacterium]
MNLQTDWPVIRQTFVHSRRSGLHHSFGSVNPDGTANVTPIGSLLLDRQQPTGFYCDVLNQQLASNLATDSRVTVLAVDSRYGAWLRAFWQGRFSRPPGFRLYGSVGARRLATGAEQERIRRLFRPVRFTAGGKALLTQMAWVRDIEFDRVEPVRIGPLTVQTYR